MEYQTHDAANTSSRKRILHVLEAGAGGTRRHLQNLLPWLDSNRFDVALAASPLRDSRFASDLEKFNGIGIEIHRIPMVRAISPVSDLRSLLSLRRIMQHGNYDIVHTHSSKAGLLGRAAARLANVPAIVHSPHVFAFQMTDIGTASRTFYRTLERLAASWTDRIFACCEAERIVAADAGLKPARGTVTIPNGIDCREWRISGKREETRASLGVGPDRFLIGFFGRFVPQKGVDRLIGIASAVSGILPAAMFLLAGDGPLKPSAVSRIGAECGETRLVSVPDTEAVRDLYECCDVVLIPSLWEGLPYTLLETMAMEKPVVASQVGGIPEVIENGKNGYFLSADKPEEAAAVIRQLAETPALAEQTGKAARKTVVERFDIDRMASEHMEQYLALLR